jgi:gamma-D-glutamyl-L-lysine dipeptidyl-peptidase
MPFLINHPVVNLYALCQEESEVISQALYGYEVAVLDRKGKWSRVQTQDGYRGWMLTSCLWERDLQAVSVVKVIHNAAHLYRMPDVKFRPLFTLPFEVYLEIAAEPEEENQRWIQVRLVDGTLAWIQRGNVQVNPPLLQEGEILALSHQFLGLPYTWGGTSSFGYDCSGYIQMLFRQRGIILPRDARDQISSSLFEEPSDMQEGDLIFFGSCPDKITHVALYIGGNRLIHASVKPIPILQVTPIDDSSLRQRFNYQTVRRLKNGFKSGLLFDLATRRAGAGWEKNLAYPAPLR